MTNLAFYSSKISAQIIKEVVYFPLWWYAQGFWQLLVRLRNFLSDRQKGLAFFVWLNNLFTPMYGQADWAGALISFFVRLAQIFIRGFVLFFWLILSVFLIILWLGMPFVVVYQIFFQLI